jgi:hypothetical protein
MKKEAEPGDFKGLASARLTVPSEASFRSVKMRVTPGWSSKVRKPTAREFRMSACDPYPTLPMHADDHCQCPSQTSL